jgi:hypothetical protein
VLLGGTAKPALRRAGRLAQGWIASSKHALEDLPASIEIVRGAAHDPEAVRIVVRRRLDGALDLAALGALGVTEVILDLNFSPARDAERVLEEYAPTRLRPSA